jgi:hypothetical protein
MQQLIELLPITPEEATIAMEVCNRLEATCNDPEEVADEMGKILTTPMFRWIDNHVWKCSDCEYWCKIEELDDNERCFGCRS